MNLNPRSSISASRSGERSRRMAGDHSPEYHEKSAADVQGDAAPEPAAHGARGKIRILIVDDHPIFREGLRQVLNTEADLVVCGEAASHNDALSAIERLHPDLVVADIALGQSNDLGLIKDIESRWPELPVLVFSNRDETLYAERCIRAGARGYVMKHQPPQELIAGLHDALQGKYHLSTEITNRIIFRLGHARISQGDPVEPLSDRELQVFEWYGKGRSTREIANELHLSVKTISSHRDHIKEKLSLKDSNSLVRSAVQWVESHNGQ